jgi:hypothetical protein
MASAKVVAVDKGMRGVKKAMEEGKNPLSEGEILYTSFRRVDEF